MKTQILCVVGFLLVGALQASSGDAEAAKEVASKFIGVFNSKAEDPAAVLNAIIADDFVFVGDRPNPVKGKAAGVAMIAGGVKAASPHCSSFQETFEPMSVQILGDAAVVSGRVETTATLRQSGQVSRSQAHLVLVLRRGKSGWLIVHETFVPMPQEEAGADAESGPHD